MSTGVIIVLIVVAAVIVVSAVARLVMARRASGGASLKRSFGPEYDRAVARHDGDAKAAERDLADRVQRHGSLRRHPLEPAARERYEARWAAAQERFVDSPREAVVEADRLLAELAGARGFPDGDRYDEQLDALSVHHPHHVHGYRRIHRAAHVSAAHSGTLTGTSTTGTSTDTLTGVGESRAGTEELREAMLEARVLFEDLVTPGRDDMARHRADDATTPPDTPAATRSHRLGNRLHAPWAFNRHHAKGS
ncbi:hypothetical protein [Streptomyces sporangiiformans]|uniref:Secreted protein n=1 Tax=Streptomyces sporangiiformans TaxID=2315329 RepID=A0A505D6K4_9ACTN|nr:hypothetical protein [Streptomyces sporangiiformans]TPQ17872.1 hypothetical protein FGD71_034020 [Streptomyces sporangiiformans]